MTNIELLNRQELNIFLEHSLKVALFQEHKSKNYVRLLGKISCRAYKILMSDNDELEQIYPEITAGIYQDRSFRILILNKGISFRKTTGNWL